MLNDKVLKSIKLPLAHVKDDADTLDGQSRICNWLSNHLLELAETHRAEYIRTQNKESAKIVYSPRGLRNLLPALKERHPFLKVVHSSPLKNTALRSSKSIDDHQKSKKGKRKGKEVGWPKFKSWSRNWYSLLYDEPGKGFKVEKDILILSLGKGKDRSQRYLSIPIIGAEALEGKEIRTLRIIKELGVFYAVFTVRVSVPKTKPITNVIALDPNHKNLAYGVDTEKNGIEIVAPTWLKIYDRRMDELRSLRDRCQRKSEQIPVVDEHGQPTGKTYWKPSKQWEKRNRVLERMLRKRRDQTKLFLYTIANALYAKYDCVGIGDYAPHGNGITTKMRRGMNNRSLIGRLKETLSWVACKSGKTFLIYNEKGTTRTCHPCGCVIEGGLSPSIRRWRCPSCSSVNDRDENASKNGFREILRDLSKSGMFVPQVSGSDLVQVDERWAWRVLPGGVLKTPRRQNSDLIATPGN